MAPTSTELTNSADKHDAEMYGTKKPYRSQDTKVRAFKDMGV